MLFHSTSVVECPACSSRDVSRLQVNRKMFVTILLCLPGGLDTAGDASTAGFATSAPPSPPRGTAYSTSEVGLNKNAVALQRHGGMKREVFVQATGAIRGSPPRINPRMPMCRMLVRWEER